ncbi:CapA family protein [Arthrobacter sp. D3-16]
MTRTSIDVMLVGDLVLDGPDIQRHFDNTRETLSMADVAVGHVEVPHTLTGAQAVFASPAPLIDPANLDAVGAAGFDICTLAGNHIYDRGQTGIEDTVEALESQGILTTGAGLNIDHARRPAIIARGGRKVGVLSYNCVGTRETWASAGKAGCAFVRILSHYELDYASPGSPPEAFTFAEPASLEAMEQDIRQLRELVDVVVVALHKGLVHTPATIADYEKQVAHAAVDAGADIVIGHHAHVLQGIELYKGKPIFHGLGNFVTTTPALNVSNNNDPDALAWAKRRRKLFNFEPSPGYEKYPFHPEAKHAFIAAVTIGNNGNITPGFLPCVIGPDASPRLVGRTPEGQAVAEYVKTITRESGFPTTFTWDGDRVLVA